LRLFVWLRNGRGTNLKEGAFSASSLNVQQLAFSAGNGKLWNIFLLRKIPNAKCGASKRIQNQSVGKKSITTNRNFPWSSCCESIKLQIQVNI